MPIPTRILPRNLAPNLSSRRAGARYRSQGKAMTDSGTTTDALLRRAEAGDTAALGALFAHYRDRLRQMVRLRLDRRLAGRLDPSDVLQEAYLDVARRFPEYAAAPAVPIYVWQTSGHPGSTISVC